MPILYAEFKGQQQFVTQAPIPGLSLTIPEGAGEQALIILNVPASYNVGGSGDGSGGQFNLSVDGTMLPEYAAYNYGQYGSYGLPLRMPATLVVAVPLTLKQQTVVAYAQTCIIDTSASLSVLI